MQQDLSGGGERHTGVFAAHRSMPAGPGSYQEAVARLQEDLDGVAALHAHEQRLAQEQAQVRAVCHTPAYDQRMRLHMRSVKPP